MIAASRRIAVLENARHQQIMDVAAMASSPSG